MNICICPGSFDPVTNGHLDIIDRASRLCDHLIVAVGNNKNKASTFSVDERVELLKIAIGDRPGISVESFDGLLIDFAARKNAQAVVKGLRAVSDFEYEFQMALLNKNLVSSIETLFIMTNVNYSYLSSSAVKELASNGGNIDGLVPDIIKDRILNKYKRA
ncbi:MAG: pantetheine-phosphate adenylyltransferase [Eubacteriales bacterium]|nr:pantetheine-phosphate adenylyltransferase [Eubacteriales bacterium]